MSIFDENENIGKRTERLKDVSDEEVIILREDGLSYNDIAQYFADRKIKVSYQTIKRIYDEYYEKRKQEKPIIKRKPKRIEKLKALSNEEIANLRNKGFTYQEIKNYYADKGIKVSYGTIRNTCENYYKKNNLEEPKLKTQKFMNEVSEEELIKLKEERLTYKQIREYYTKKGIEVSSYTISKIYEKLYKEGKLEKTSRKKEKKKRLKNITDEELIKLRKEGLTYKKIVEYYANKGIKVHESIVCRRCKKLNLKKTRIRKDNVLKIKEATDEEIVDLRKKRLSYRKISKYFADKGIKISYQGIINRLKNIEKYDKEENNSLEELNNKLNELLIKKEETKDLLQRFTNVVVKVRNELDQKEKGETR